jgi:hypothetical protein
MDYLKEAKVLKRIRMKLINMINSELTGKKLDKIVVLFVRVELRENRIGKST